VSKEVDLGASAIQRDDQIVLIADRDRIPQALARARRRPRRPDVGSIVAE
jgi:hypothetical protein